MDRSLDELLDDVAGGRLSAEIDDWSVEKIKRAGGDAVKVLTWYRPDGDPDRYHTSTHAANR